MNGNNIALRGVPQSDRVRRCESVMELPHIRRIIIFPRAKRNRKVISQCIDNYHPQLIECFGCQHPLVMSPAFQSTPLPSGETSQEDFSLRTSRVSKNPFVNRNNPTPCRDAKNNSNSTSSECESLNMRCWNKLRFRTSGSRECADASLISGSSSPSPSPTP